MNTRLLLAAAVLGLPLAASAQKVTYDEHVLPLFKNQCLKCHNADKPKADLDLSTYGGTMKGGSSGLIVTGGDPDGSSLYKVVTHAAEPTMPPKSKLADKEIDLIKKWIAGGLLENSGSKAIASNRPKVDLSLSAASFGKPEGAPPMPGDLLLEPVVRTARTSASTALAASPWAPLVAVGGQKQVFLYNTDTLQLAGVFPFPEGFPHDVKFSRNGKLLLAGGGRGANKGVVAVWDITTGERILTAGDELDVALAADISSNQKWVALGGPDRLVKIYATATGEQLHKMKKHTDWVLAAEFNHTSTYLATGDRNGGVVVWDAEVGQEVQTFTGHRGAITSVAWRTPDLLVTASEDGTVKTWSVKEGQQVKSVNAHNSTVSVRLNVDGLMVTAGRDKTISTWDKEGNKAKTFTITNDLPVRATLTHDGKRVIATDWTGRAYVWNVADGRELTGLSLNPPTIAEQQKQVAQRITDLETELPKLQARLAEATVATVKAKADQDAAKDGNAKRSLTLAAEVAAKKQGEAKAAIENAESELQIARSSVDRLKLGAFYAQVWRAKEDFTARKDEQKRLLAEADSAKGAIKQAEDDIKAAKKIKTTSKEEKAKIAKRIKDLEKSISDNKKLATSSKSAADKMTKPLQAEEKRLQALTTDYQKMKAASASAPVKSAKL
jgi:mono/diheme cytochrome c family protein